LLNLACGVTDGELIVVGMTLAESGGRVGRVVPASEDGPVEWGSVI
jgi:hypothetical protein